MREILPPIGMAVAVLAIVLCLQLTPEKTGPVLVFLPDSATDDGIWQIAERTNSHVLGVGNTTNTFVLISAEPNLPHRLKGEGIKFVFNYFGTVGCGFNNDSDRFSVPLGNV